MSRRVSIKVDCDTFEGTRDGIPRLLETFAAEGVRASFFFTLGPDRSGRAVSRVFTRRGFLSKMLRSNAVSLYGPKTMLYGTLLPAPHIGRRLADVIRQVERAGHEVGVHGWDHVRWHDKLDRMSPEQVALDYGRAHDVFRDIFGRRATSSAAPGWHATAVSLALQDDHGLLYASDTRGGRPFRPSINGRSFRHLQIPTTLPTWDEALCDRRFQDGRGLVEAYARHTDDEVHTIHTEVEGGPHIALFRALLAAWKADGARFITLEERAREAMQSSANIPVREIHRAEIPDRGGLVSVSGESVAL